MYNELYSIVQKEIVNIFLQNKSPYLIQANAGSHPILSQNKKIAYGDFFILGRMTGFEPATFGTTNQRSNQLSYIRHTHKVRLF